MTRYTITSRRCLPITAPGSFRSPPGTGASGCCRPSGGVAPSCNIAWLSDRRAVHSTSLPHRAAKKIVPRPMFISRRLAVCQRPQPGWDLWTSATHGSLAVALSSRLVSSRSSFLYVAARPHPWRDSRRRREAHAADEATQVFTLVSDHCSSSRWIPGLSPDSAGKR